MSDYGMPVKLAFFTSPTREMSPEQERDLLRVKVREMEKFLADQRDGPTAIAVVVETDARKTRFVGGGGVQAVVRTPTIVVDQDGKEATLRRGACESAIGRERRNEAPPGLTPKDALTAAARLRKEHAAVAESHREEAVAWALKTLSAESLKDVEAIP